MPEEPVSPQESQEAAKTSTEQSTPQERFGRIMEHHKDPVKAKREEHKTRNKWTPDVGPPTPPNKEVSLDTYYLPVVYSESEDKYKPIVTKSDTSMNNKELGIVNRPGEKQILKVVGPDQKARYFVPEVDDPDKPIRQKLNEQRLNKSELPSTHSPIPMAEVHTQNELEVYKNKGYEVVTPEDLTSQKKYEEGMAKETAARAEAEKPEHEPTPIPEPDVPSEVSTDKEPYIAIDEENAPNWLKEITSKPPESTKQPEETVIHRTRDFNTGELVEDVMTEEGVEQRRIPVEQIPDWVNELEDKPIPVELPQQPAEAATRQ